MVPPAKNSGSSGCAMMTRMFTGELCGMGNDYLPGLRLSKGRRFDRV